MKSKSTTSMALAPLHGALTIADLTRAVVGTFDTAEKRKQINIVDTAHKRNFLPLGWFWVIKIECCLQVPQENGRFVLLFSVLKMATAKS